MTRSDSSDTRNWLSRLETDAANPSTKREVIAIVSNRLRVSAIDLIQRECAQSESLMGRNRNIPKDEGVGVDVLE